MNGDLGDSPICSLCGFVAEADAWDSVDHAWRTLLAESGSFDAIACLHGTSIYQSWKILRRHALLSELSGTLARSDLVPVGAFVIQQEFWRLSPPDRAVLAAEDVTSPLDLVFSNLTERMICLAHEKSEKISLAVDREPHSAGRYNAIFNKQLGRYLLGPHLLGALALVDTQGSMHLQVAKLLGEAVLFIEKRKTYSRQAGNFFDLPLNLQQLGERIHQQGRFDAVKLEKFVAKLKNIGRQS
jgi:hypothetical protein